jgi:hypothetical protein
VDARERLPVELAHGRVRKKIQTLRAVELGNRKRLSKDDTRTRAASRRVWKNRQRGKIKKRDEELLISNNTTGDVRLLVDGIDARYGGRPRVHRERRKFV